MKPYYNLIFLALLYTLMAGCATTRDFFEKDIQDKGSTDTPTKVTTPPSPQKDPNNNPVGREERTSPENMLSIYRLGPGDRVSIKVFGEPELSVEAHLSDGGTISYPLLGEIQITGLTIGELERKIAARLNDGYVKEAKVTVTILEYRQIYINGAVQKPGGYAFMPGLTVDKAISLAGGFTAIASTDKVLITREGHEKISATLNTPIQPGDVITIGESIF
jgi:polysaccharide export outer membrane protein